MSIVRLVPWLVVIAVAGCAPAPPATAPPSAQTDTAPAARQPDVQRTLIIIGGRSPENLASKPLRNTGGAGNPIATIRTLNAGLAINDDRNLPHPYLAEALPQLNSDTWRVFADSRMETTYRLRPNLTWHDGRPLSAEDFVFAHRVYSAPDFGLADSPPLNYIDDVQAPDARTVLIRWRQPFADAADLQAVDFPPLPRHLLGATYNQGQAEAFLALPYWTTDFVGLGPYKLSRFDLGTSLDSTAFDEHALGRPRIDQLRFTYITDGNTAMANLLSGAAHVSTDNSIDLQQAVVLERQWSANGTVLRPPVGVRHANVQLRPDFATPRTLQDLRVRKALYFATDRQALVEGITEGLGSVADTFVLPNVDFFPAIDRVITKYPYDARRADQLLVEAGYAKASDGIYASPSDGRFAMEVAVAQGARNDTEVQVVADGLKRVGIDTSIRIIPRVQITEAYVLANFPGILIGSHNRAVIPPLNRFRVSEIARPETRGRGNNYAGWSNPEAERLIASYETALDPSERTQRIADLLKLVSDEVPIYPLYYNLEFFAYANGLRGPLPAVLSDAATWNIHEWYWTQ